MTVLNCVWSRLAIAVGLQTLKINQRPHELPMLQAAAAIGQMGLVQAWQSCFSACGRETAQVLPTHEELADRKRYLNARYAENVKSIRCDSGRERK